MTTSFVQEISQFLSQKTKKDPSFFVPFIEKPPSLEMGDYSFICFPLAKELKKNPKDLAQELAQAFPPSPHFDKVISTGPYLNFFVNQKFYQTEIIQDIVNKKELYGSSHEETPKTIVLEYSSPNIAKPFHIGHFRATIIGNSLKKIFEMLGHTCIGINYLGDWGTQFGKLICAFKKWGDVKDLKDDPIQYLHSLYVRFHSEAKSNPSLEEEAREWFKKCEKKDPEALKLWKEFKELSLKEFKLIYDDLHVQFDEVSGESHYDEFIPKTISEIQASLKTQISEGALIIDLEKFGMPPALLLRSDGASLYLTRDIAALFDRHNRLHFDKIIYVVGDTQTLHFKQLFKIIELMGKPWVKNCHHIAFGQIRFKDQKMSTREGKAIWLEDMLHRSTELISKIIEEKNPTLKDKKEVAQKVGLGAIIFADFSSKRIKNSVFDWDVILNPDGDTGPYVLYTYARASSILRKACHPEKKACHPEQSEGSLIPLESPEERMLIGHLERFPHIIASAAHDFEPCYIANYLLDLDKLFNRFYHEHRVIQENPDLQSARLKLVTATRQVMSTGLSLLGIEPPEEL